MRIAESEYVSFASAGTRGLIYLGVLDALEDHLAMDSRGGTAVCAASRRRARAPSPRSCSPRPNRAARHEILRDHLVRRVVSRPDFLLLLRQYGCEDGEAFKGVIQRILARGGLSSTSMMADLQRLLRIDVIRVYQLAHRLSAL